jgi:hypothetical protein
VQATAVGFTLIVASQEEVRITGKDTDGVLGSEKIKGAAVDSAFVTLDQFRSPGGKTLNGTLQEISIPMLAHSESTSIERSTTGSFNARTWSLLRAYGWGHRW